ncbi:hypothetical protein ACFQVC_35920 [Streptomyces monticola]|uniref:Uncharacterized protein n=1 Tax=Streptomyces monticola TaxID=2666263 RepID=A0ABW2JUX2_9ACTN
MSDIVDSDELLRRLRVARDWAEEQRSSRLARQGDAAQASDVIAYGVVRDVLDKVIEPGADPT